MKFYGNATCLTSPYLISNLPKRFKFAVFKNLLVNFSKNNVPRKLNFGGPLGGMLHYLRIKFRGESEVSKWVIFHLKHEKILQNCIFWIKFWTISKVSWSVCPSTLFWVGGKSEKCLRGKLRAPNLLDNY